jgi:ketosteroid isomerase-like protein
MPSRERVLALVAMVEEGKYVEAIETFYTDDATMQENDAPPRGGREVLVAGERKVLAAHKSARTEPGSSFLLDGDRVVIHWRFKFVLPDGKRYRMDELALQRWRGDRISEERFFYDPGQRRRFT